MRAYSEKKYDEAIISFNNALSHKPDSYSALCLLGTSYAYKKDLKMAEKTLHDAITLFPDNWNAYILLGDLKRNQRDYTAAIDFYETAVTLESMSGKEKTYYKKFLKEIKNEQYSFETKLLDKRKNMSQDTEREIKDNFAPKAKQIGNININLDKEKWVKAYEDTDGKNKITEYGIKGEDVSNFKWTQLVTLQYITITKEMKLTLDSYFDTQIKAIEEIAQNNKKSFEKQIINQSANEILYSWKFDGEKESELARIVYTPQGIYHIHFAKKGAFTEEEKNKYLNLMKHAIFE